MALRPGRLILAGERLGRWLRALVCTAFVALGGVVVYLGIGSTAVTSAVLALIIIVLERWCVEVLTAERQSTPASWDCLRRR